MSNLTAEHKRAALLTETGLSTGTIQELEKIWLETETGETGTLPELESHFLTDKGYSTGTIGERWYAYLGGLGYTGTLDERLHTWWAAGGSTLVSFLLLETGAGDYLVLEDGSGYLVLE